MEPTNPTNPLDWIIRILMLFLFALLIYPQRSASGPARPEPRESQRVLHHIDSVRALVMESFPMQVSLHVTGYQSDGCELPVQVTQRRDGNTIYVDIFREMSADTICPAIVMPYEADIRLEGGFVNENYTVNVNGFVVELSFGPDQPGQPQPGQSQPGQSQPGQPGLPPRHVLSIIESVEVGRYPSFAAYPAVLYLNVSGSHPDGCQLPLQTAQRREGNTVYVDVFRELPNGMGCAAVLTPFEVEIPLESSFEKGQYTFNVNGFVVTFSP